MTDSRSLHVFIVGTIAILWALNWPMMKIGLEVLEPWTMRAILVLSGGVGALAIGWLCGDSLKVPRGEIIPLLWVGLFQGLLWNGLSAFGIAYLDAGRAAVLAFTMPMWATLLAAIFLREAITGRAIAGLALGMTGMALLLVPSLGTLGPASAGALLMLASAISWAIATIIVKGTRWTISPFVLSGWQFMIGFVPLALAAVTLGDPASVLDLDARTGSAFAYSAIMPMVYCQAMFFAIVRRLPASLASMNTLLIPPLGVIFSAMVLGEHVGPLEICAVVLVVGAMVLILPGFTLRSLRIGRAPSRAG